MIIDLRADYIAIRAVLDGHLNSNNRAGADLAIEKLGSKGFETIAGRRSGPN